MCWDTFIISIFGLVFHQIILWCCFHNKLAIRILPVVSCLSTFSLFCHGMIVLVSMIADADFSESAANDANADNIFSRDASCPERARIFEAFISFASAMLWLASAGCMIAFVAGGRQARWEKLMVTPTKKERPTELDDDDNSPSTSEMGDDNSISPSEALPSEELFPSEI
jgi:hypothetical protein